MDLELRWLLAILLVVVAAAHIAEEAATGFRRFFNMAWFAGTEDCPVTRFKGLILDEIGLFLTLSLFAVLGAVHNWTWIFISIGIIAADVAQHLTFSIAKKGYTPGVAPLPFTIIYAIKKPPLTGRATDNACRHCGLFDDLCHGCGAIGRRCSRPSISLSVAGIRPWIYGDGPLRRCRFRRPDRCQPISPVLVSLGTSAACRQNPAPHTQCWTDDKPDSSTAISYSLIPTFLICR